MPTIPILHLATAPCRMTWGAVVEGAQPNGWMMRFISTRAHGVADYFMAVLLIASPWLFGFAAGGAETWIPVIIGAGAIVYSLMTAYEMGVVPALSMKTHLVLDLAAGLVLIVSPWVFGFSGEIWIPHVVFGVLEIGAALTTKTTPLRIPHSRQHSPSAP